MRYEDDNGDDVKRQVVFVKVGSRLSRSHREYTKKVQQYLYREAFSRTLNSRRHSSRSDHQANFTFFFASIDSHLRHSEH